MEYSAWDEPQRFAGGEGEQSLSKEACQPRGQGLKMQGISLPCANSREQSRKLWGQCLEEGPGEEGLTASAVIRGEWWRPGAGGFCLGPALGPEASKAEILAGELLASRR